MQFPSFPRFPAKFSSKLRIPAILGIAVLAAAAAACPCARAQSTAPPATYTFTDLGTLPGDVYSVGYAINESGDVAGYSVSSSGQMRAVIFKDGKVIDLGLAPGANGSAAYGINGYDQATGEVDFPVSGYDGFVSHAFLYSAGKMQDVGTLQFPGAPLEVDFGLGTAINDSGQIAGAASTVPIFSAENANVFLYSAGKLTGTPLTDAVSFFDSFANGIGNNINASGQIAGVGAIFNSSNGSTTSLGAGNATAINDSGQATGFLSSSSHAFLSSKGKVTDIAALPGLGPYSYGTGINASGQIVGISGDAQGDYGYPFLYTPGQGVTLLPLGVSMHLAINDKGQITGTQAGHAFLLSPVFTAFSTFDTVVDIIGKPGTTFAAGGRFTLGTTSYGIDPLTETTVLQLGGYHISIPPGYFVKQSNGVYYYHGKIGNVSTYAVIRPVAANVFLFGVVGEGAAGLPPSYPLNLVLSIGTDTGTESIPTNYNSGLTVAEACQIFGLTCN